MLFSIRIEIQVELLSTVNLVLMSLKLNLAFLLMLDFGAGGFAVDLL